MTRISSVVVVLSCICCGDSDPAKLSAPSDTATVAHIMTVDVFRCVEIGDPAGGCQTRGGGVDVKVTVFDPRMPTRFIFLGVDAYGPSTALLSHIDMDPVREGMFLGDHWGFSSGWSNASLKEPPPYRIVATLREMSGATLLNVETKETLFEK